MPTSWQQCREMKHTFQFSVVIGLLGLFGLSATAETISGLISESGGGTPLAGIEVEVYRVDLLPRELSTVATSGVDGVYQATVGPGIYSVRMVDPQALQSTSCYGGTPDLDTATKVTVLAGADAVGLDVALVPAGSVSGTVLAASGGAALQGIQVSLYVETSNWWSWVADATTDSDGQYTVPGVPPGTYHAEFFDASEVYLSLVHSSGTKLSQGTNISVGEGQAITGLDASLTLGSLIQGTVTTPDGQQPASPIRVRVLQTDGLEYTFHTDTVTEPDGTYTVRGLKAAVYKILFEDPTGGCTAEYLGDSPTLAGGTPVVLGTGVLSPGRDIELNDASAVEGTVIQSGSGTPVADVRVSAYQSESNLWRSVFSGLSDSNGIYRVQGLPTGAYRVAFQDNGLESLSEVWADSVGLEAGSNIAVPVSGTTGGQDTQLAPGARVSGTVTASDGVTPLEEIWVSAYAWENGNPRWLRWAVTDAAGNYEIQGLESGACRVVFDDWNRTYLSEVYDDVLDLENGVDLSLTEGSLVSGVDASLGLASTLSGVVFQPNGTTPVPGILVTLYGWDGAGWVAIETVTTDGAGVYTLIGLSSDAYRLGYQDPSGTYIDSFYGGAEFVEDAADVVVGSEVSLTGIDFSLELPGAISGAVTTINIFEGLIGIPLFVERTTTGERTYGVSSIFGWYTIGGLRPGQYRLGTELESGSIYVDEWYPNLHRGPEEPAPPGAALIQVNSGATSGGKTFRLDIGGEVSGSVTAMGAVPLASAAVTLTGSYGSYTAETDLEGAYTIVGVAPDSYTLKVAAPGLVDEWWSGAQVATNAVAFPVNLPDVVTRDVDLDPGQGQALVAVTSDPPGADIYLDFHAVGAVTPALIDVGEAYPSQIDLPHVAPHVVTVYLPGSPLPAPVPANALEGETRTLHFDLTGTGSGAVEISTTPEGAEVYLDTATAPIGLSPILLTDLAPGTHTILIRKAGYLVPRPVDVSVSAGIFVPVEVPLTPAPTAFPASVTVQSVPPRARLYVNYLLPGIDTDTQVSNLDPASYAGENWQSMSHVVLLRKPGYRAPVPRKVDPEAGSDVLVGCVLLPDTEMIPRARSASMPDEWQRAYDLVELAPGEAGPEDDPDGDGFTNQDEMRAGTHPLDVFSNMVSEMGIILTAEGPALQMTFPSVAGQRYLIQCIDVLTDPNGWQLVAGGLVGDGTTIKLEAPLTGTAGTRTYRALVLAP